MREKYYNMLKCLKFKRKHQFLAQKRLGVFKY